MTVTGMRRISWTNKTSYPTLGKSLPAEVRPPVIAKTKKFDQEANSEIKVLSSVHTKNVRSIDMDRRRLEKSMLAYSEKMREIQERRSEQKKNIDGVSDIQVCTSCHNLNILVLKRRPSLYITSTSLLGSDGSLVLDHDLFSVTSEPTEAKKVHYSPTIRPSTAEAIDATRTRELQLPTENISVLAKRNEQITRKPHHQMDRKLGVNSFQKERFNKL
ncbi:hypothetical protein ACJMK2_043261 [Sinanodonta woodiana]|uniref:Uncharacterized protein n=1 Tax=Sinanodonta woodiana TaxID=1069815 RepID=A0ABD3VWD0_SINWO